jgi:hypothetical protein
MQRVSPLRFKYNEKLGRVKSIMLEKFLPRTDFDSYEDLKANYKVVVPEGFNFAYDVVDAWAEVDKNKKALFWCTDEATASCTPSMI